MVPPLTLLLLGLLSTALIPQLSLPRSFDHRADLAARSVTLIALFWLASRAVGLVQREVLSRPWALQTPQVQTLVPLIGRFVRVLLAAVALLAVLTQFGYSVSTLLAGIGLGGVALALASQKSMEHLFGSVALASDQVFRVGDFVRIGELEGTVERVGLRSTSIRTVRRTVIRIPNGKLAEERIETYSERDRFLFQHDFVLPFTTSAADVRSITRALDEMLTAHARIWQPERRVDMVGFADSGIRMRVMCWFTTPSWSEFMTAQHYLLLTLKETVEQHGVELALPARVVQLTAAPTLEEPLRALPLRAAADPAVRALSTHSPANHDSQA
jgi:MscS family membrane protein